MSQEIPQNELLIRYFLGELSEGEQTRLEEEYFANPQLFAELRSRRDDLLDSYARGELSPAERQRVEEFARTSPRMCERIEFAHSLRQVVDSRAPAEAKQTQRSIPRRRSLLELLRSYRQPIFAAAILVFIIAGSWFVIRSVRQQQTVGPDRADLSTPSLPPRVTSSPTSQAGTPQVQAPTSKPTPASKPVVASFLLTSDLVRGSGETQTLTIQKEAAMIQLRLTLEGKSHGRYAAMIRTPEGAEIWRQRQLPSQTGKSGSVVVLSVPANLLNSDDYIVRLNGVTEAKEIVNAGNYYFRVVKR